jgi:hypothetical protein
MKMNSIVLHNNFWRSHNDSYILGDLKFLRPKFQFLSRVRTRSYLASSNKMWEIMLGTI